MAHLMALLAISTTISAQNVATDSVAQPAKKSKLTLGGYGEAAFSRHFYSDNQYRYSRMLQVMDVSTFRMQLSILVTTLERAGAWEQKSNSNTQAQVLLLK